MFENVSSYFVKLFFVLNPHIVVPFFLSCTQNYTSSERKIVGAKMCIYAFALGLVFCVLGNKVLDALGISKAAFKAGGGLLLAKAAWGMLYSKPTPPSEGTSPEISMRSDIALCPLAFPMLVGPATLTTIVGMIKDAEAIGFVEQGLIVATMGVIIAITYVCLLGGGTIMKILGKNGPVILEKAGGILLIGMSIEMICWGLKLYFFS
jgi:multiple antibiotic resistance protein